jgi:hypothetical protein
VHAAKSGEHTKPPLVHYEGLGGVCEDLMKAVRTFAVALGFLVGASEVPASAAQFNQFVGNWAGSGTITIRDGARERLRCRVRFTGGNNELSLSLRCASDSYKFELQSDITADGNNISGSWNELTRHVYGTISGRTTGNRIDASAVAAGFTASISLFARGNSQQVSIRAPGSEISEVAISLSRGGR